MATRSPSISAGPTRSLRNLRQPRPHRALVPDGVLAADPGLDEILLHEGRLGVKVMDRFDVFSRFDICDEFDHACRPASDLVGIDRAPYRLAIGCLTGGTPGRRRIGPVTIGRCPRDAAALRHTPRHSSELPMRTSALTVVWPLPAPPAMAIVRRNRRAPKPKCSGRETCGA
jgi:hypothetical protein